MTDTMITTATAARLLGLSRQSVLAFIASGKLPAQKHGRDWMIEPSDLELVKVRRPVGYPKGRPRGKKAAAAEDRAAKAQARADYYAAYRILRQMRSGRIQVYMGPLGTVLCMGERIIFLSINPGMWAAGRVVEATSLW